jgi:hypothetical protein
MQNGLLAPAHQALDAMTFAAWLDQQGLDDPHLRWYLDYCCRDDYGAGTARVSAWAGIHYFASRHGFHAPGEAAAEDREGVLTWPEGNGWLTQRLAAPLHDGGQLHTACSVLRITEGRHGVQVDAFNHATDSVERWQAQRCIVALPVFMAARVVQGPPAFLREAAQRLSWAPWLVANIHIDAPLADRPGAAPAWDNVLYGDANPGGLGYVDAGHQRLQSKPDATVLTYYRALGDHAGGAAALPSAAGVAGRHWLLAQPWHQWRDRILTELSVAHPDLVAKVSRIDITRYGHAMAIPTPSNTRQISLKPILDNVFKLSKSHHSVDLHRLQFAHSDWVGYSVFEEAFTLGHWADGRRRPGCRSHHLKSGKSKGLPTESVDCQALPPMIPKFPLASSRRVIGGEFDRQIELLGLIP